MTPNEVIEKLRKECFNDLNKQIGIPGISDEYPKVLKTESSLVIDVLKIVDTHDGVESITAVLVAAPDNLQMSDNDISEEIIKHGEFNSPINKDNIRIGRYDEN
jgi:hypothetical protein